MPTNFVLTSAYSADKETSVILTNIRVKTPLDQQFLPSISLSYRQELATDKFEILNYRLLFLEHVDTSQKCLCRIAFPLSLHRVLFSTFHTSP